MEDVTESLSAAWKEAMKGVRVGYRKTKSVLRQIPVDRLKALSGTGGVMSRSDIRRFFRMKYGREVSNSDGGQVAEDETTDADSSDGEPLTDAQVHEKVDKKFFDKTYDAAKFELEHMEGFAYTDDEAESQAMREASEGRILELRQKCNTVSTTLKRRVLVHHHSFVSGTEKIRDINDSLLMTSSDCKKARAAIRKSKAAVASQVRLLAQQRTRENIEATIQLLEAMQTMCWKRTQLTNLISSGKVHEAVGFVKREGGIEMENSLKNIYCMRSVMAEWSLYRDNPEKLTDCIEVVLTDCLTNKFIASTYRNVLEASQELGRATDTCALVASLLWRAAVQILCKSLTDVSVVKCETTALASIADGIHPDHLILGVRQMCAKLMDFLYLYSTVVRLHREEGNTNSSFSALHHQALRCVQDVGRNIGCDLVEKLIVVLSHARLAPIDLDCLLHLFLMVSMLVEGLGALGLEGAEQTAARTKTKAVLLHHMQTYFQMHKAHEVLAFMGDDDWTVSSLPPLSLNMVKPLSPSSFKSVIKEVKDYLHQGTDDSSLAAGTRPLIENPFLTQKMLVPADMSSLVQTQTFGAYWAATKTGCVTAAADESAASKSLIGDSKSRAEIAPHGVSVSDKAFTLASSLNTPPSTLTSSSMFVANAFLEYQARVAVRFPPLASDILEWCEELMCLYFYTVVDNFVSVSRSVPIEHQGDISVTTQRVLAEVRTAAERAVGAVSGQYRPKGHGLHFAGRSVTGSNATTSRFPPVVWGRLSSNFTSAAQQFALGNRALACQSVITIILLYDAMIQTMSPLLPPAVVSSYMQRCRALYEAAHEVLHVCIHRLCLAICPMESVCNDIARLKGNKNEMTVSSYVAELVGSMRSLNERRAPMPTADLEAFFLQRLIFAAQLVLVREYSKLSKKRMSDLLVMQLQVDVQTFQQKVVSIFGKSCIVVTDYVLRLVKAGFFAGDKVQCVQWVRTNHTLYYSVDLVNWFGAADKPFILQLEDLLGKELKHKDILPMDHFAL